MDFVVDGIEEYIAVTIVSDDRDAIRRATIEQLGSGFIELDGKRGFSLEHGQLRNTEVHYSVIARLEVIRFLNSIRSIEPGAFIVMTTAKDLRGVKRRRHQQ